MSYEDVKSVCPGRVIITEDQSCPPITWTNDLTHYGLFLREVMPPNYWGETVIF